MKLTRRVRRGCCIAVLALPLTGCGTATPPEGGSSPGTGSATVLPTGETATAPPSEGAGPEEPQQGEDKGPAFPIASLPIGGSVTLPGREPECAQVSLKADLPRAVSVAVTGAHIDSALFEVADSGCGGGDGPLCRDSSFTFTIDRTECVVPVRATGPVDSEAHLILDGVASCPAGQETSCQDFVSDGQHGSVELFGPEQSEGGSPEEESTGSDSTGTDG
jgi:hypothetical protein